MIYKKKIKITQIRSSIGIKKQHKIILKLLGLLKIHRFVIKQYDQHLLSFIKKIFYLIKCENIYEIK